MSIPDQKDSDWEWTFHYVLLEKVDSHNLKDSSDIRFIRDSSSYLEGFYIKINNADSREAERIGEKKAKNLNNILTIKSGMTINARLSNFEGINKNKVDGEKQPIAKNLRVTFSIKGGIEELDLNDSAISRLINEDTNPQLEYLNDAVSHMYHGRIAECITIAFKVIEGRSSLQNYSKYKCLRDIFSHPPPYYRKTIMDFIKEFTPSSFDFSEYNPGNKTIILNLGSTKTRKSLDKLAQDLIKDAKTTLNLE